MKRSMLLRYGVAVVAVGVVLLAKLLLDPLIAEQAPFLLLSVAVMVGAWFGGLGPGVLATALATLVADYFFLPPLGSFTGLSAAFLPLALFVVQGLVISSLTQALHSARQRAERSALEAEARYRALVEQIPAITYIEAVDRGGRSTSLLYVSPQIEDVFGYSPEEWILSRESGQIRRVAKGSKGRAGHAGLEQPAQRRPHNPPHERLGNGLPADYRADHKPQRTPQRASHLRVVALQRGRTEAEHRRRPG